METDNKQLYNDNNIEKDKYFISVQHRYIFALVELDGENRAKILEITKELYNEKKKADIWYHNILKLIHPDICKIDGSEEAMTKLNKLHSSMIKKETEDE